ncbi:NADP-dependent oxidoreductase [Microlunatus ginsengisoli]|uniref:NADP-dependent oxidoreductase n=1 Tax=Microlunatus ginsengisoli TaxID=363863 RepID=A0ABP6ZSJ2_9ACTN
MKALQFSEYGGPEVLRWAEAEEPHAGPGQIRIKVAAASINPIDWKLSTGMFAGGKPMEGVGRLGFDAAGVVDEIGDGVTGVQVGDDVFGRGNATQAEFAVLDAWALKPSSVDWALAAAAGVSIETAERGLRLVGVEPGQTLFVDGGAGGVGATVVQVAIARGIRVIASAGEGNQDYLREIRAIPVVYGDGVADRARAAAGGDVDAVFDVAGKTPIAELIGLVPEPAKVVTIANYGAAESGVILTRGGADSHPFEALAQGARLLESSQLVIKFQTFPFDRAAEAYAISLGGHVRGKLVLVP